MSEKIHSYHEKNRGIYKYTGSQGLEQGGIPFHVKSSNSPIRYTFQGLTYHQ